MSQQKIQQTRTTTNNSHTQEISLTQSPLPSADELAKLQKIDSELVKKIVNLVEKEQNHRHSIDNGQLDIIQKNANSNRFIGKFGVMAGFLLLGGFGFGSGYLIMNGFSVIGTIGCLVTAIATLSSIISVSKENSTAK